MNPFDKWRRLVIGLLSLMTLVAVEARCGLVSLENTRGQCERDYAGSAYPLIWKVVSQRSYGSQLSNGDYNYTMQFDLMGYNEFAGSQACSEIISVTYRNDPNGPSVDQARREALLLMLKQSMRSRPRTFDPTRDSDVYYRDTRTRACGCGVRGSLDKHFVGINLTEASPDWAIRYVNLTQTNIRAGEVIYMVVEAKGDEDWVELAVNGTVFMKLSLTNFTVGQYYEIDVPASLLVEGTNSYSYFLNSAGAVDSKVFFPLALPEDAPPKIGSSSITNSLFSLQLSNLVFGLDYSIQQSPVATTNWQPVAIFTATNDFHVLSVPMTNSTMFYRATVLPP